MVARISGDVQQFHIAEHASATVLDSPNAVPYLAFVARVGLALMAVQKGDAKAAGEYYVALEFAKGVMALYICIDRLLGLLGQTIGDLDKAEVHFEDALAFCRNSGYRPELAWSLCDYADMLVEHNGPTDQYMAKALFDESLSISTELGMRPLKERVESRKAELPA